MLTRRNHLLHRLPTAGLTSELALMELERAEAMLIRAAEHLSEETRRDAVAAGTALRECAAAGLWVMRWQDALDRLRDTERRNAAASHS
ncbi:MAG TPA: hypothetical protein VIR81_14995 [Myxococcales bacterium]|nr:hypothetical protein [Myxococcales bacterium]